MWIIPLDAGQMRHSIVSSHHKYEAEHDTYSEVDPLICHGGYHFPGIFARVVPLHAVCSTTKHSVGKELKYKLILSPNPLQFLRPPAESFNDLPKVSKCQKTLKVDFYTILA